MTQNNETLESILNKNKSIEKIDPNQLEAVNKAVEELFKSNAENEKDRIDRAKKNEKRAWIISAVSLAIGVISVSAVVGLTPLKQVVPIAYKVDNATGYITKVTPIGEKTSYEKIMAKYWIRSFVQFREGYDFETVQNNYDNVKMLSKNDAPVFRDYHSYITDKINSPVNIFADKNRVKVDIKNVTLLDEGLAQVRYETSVIDSSGQVDRKYPVSRWIGTMTFDYKKQGINTEGERQMNPIGFEATSWRRDREV